MSDYLNHDYASGPARGPGRCPPVKVILIDDETFTLDVGDYGERAVFFLDRTPEIVEALAQQLAEAVFDLRRMPVYLAERVPEPEGAQA